MSHHIYQTEGFIAGSFPQGEANRLIYVFSEDLGLVRAVAQSVRALHSKLRHSLQDFSFSKISFVRGKDVWRIVGAEKLELLERSMKDASKKEMVAKISVILKRFVRGEEKDAEFFADLRGGFQFLDREEFSSEEMSLFELLFVLRAMKHLGYWLPVENDELYGAGNYTEWSKENLKLARGKEQKITAIINRGFSHSHL